MIQPPQPSLHPISEASWVQNRTESSGFEHNGLYDWDFEMSLYVLRKLELHRCYFNCVNHRCMGTGLDTVVKYCSSLCSRLPMTDYDYIHILIICRLQNTRISYYWYMITSERCVTPASRYHLKTYRSK